MWRFSKLRLQNTLFKTCLRTGIHASFFDTGISSENNEEESQKHKYVWTKFPLLVKPRIHSHRAHCPGQPWQSEWCEFARTRKEDAEGAHSHILFRDQLFRGRELTTWPPAVSPALGCATGVLSAGRDFADTVAGANERPPAWPVARTVCPSNGLCLFRRPENTECTDRRRVLYKSFAYKFMLVCNHVCMHARSCNMYTCILND